MNKFRTVREHEKFKKDLKKLQKKYKTLKEDLATFIKAQLCLYHKQKIDNKGIVRIPGLGFDSPPIYKARKFACRALKGTGSRSGMRVVYTYIEEDDRIELIEIYYKGDKDSEDTKRIKDLYSTEKE
jgi:mRNA-degrading endonuclease RelE of RelBE toxin-antitoxin system